MSCVFADPVHASGGCIFANPFVIAPIPDGEVHPPGMGRRRSKQIKEEDEAIMAIIMAFLETKQ